eukprot:Opistho-2@86252
MARRRGFDGLEDGLEGLDDSTADLSAALISGTIEMSSAFDQSSINAVEPEVKPLAEIQLNPEFLTKESENSPKMFLHLCDQVANRMTQLDTIIRELFEWKDKLLGYNLPPNVLVHLTLICSKMFRSDAELHEPLLELVRLVRLYSLPWDKQTAMFQQAQEEIEIRDRKLDIALRKLEQANSEVERYRQSRRVLNWERLVSKLLMNAKMEEYYQLFDNGSTEDIYEKSIAAKQRERAAERAAETDPDTDDDMSHALGAKIKKKSKGKGKAPRRQALKSKSKERASIGGDRDGANDDSAPRAPSRGPPTPAPVDQNKQPTNASTVNLAAQQLTEDAAVPSAEQQTSSGDAPPIPPPTDVYANSGTAPSPTAPDAQGQAVAGGSPANQTPAQGTPTATRPPSALPGTGADAHGSLAQSPVPLEDPAGAVVAAALGSMYQDARMGLGTRKDLRDDDQISVVSDVPSDHSMNVTFADENLFGMQQNVAAQTFDMFDVEQEKFSIQDVMEMALVHARQMTLLQETYEKRLNELRENLRAASAQAAESMRLRQAAMRRLGPNRLVTRKGGPVGHLDEPNRVFARDAAMLGRPRGRPTKLTALATEDFFKNGIFKAKIPSEYTDIKFTMSFMDRLEYFAQEGLKKHRELADKIRNEVQQAYEQSLQTLHRLARENQEELGEDFCLPAMFMPQPGAPGKYYTPRAHQYWHPTGSEKPRATQPPSMIELPSIRNDLVPDKLRTVNLFDMSRDVEN